MVDGNKKIDNKFDDGMYRFHISEFKDGSGKICSLTRYGGNVRVLKVVLAELETQVQEFEQELVDLTNQKI